jgi:hypothetical protein
MPKGVGYGEASKMGYFGKKERAARKKKKADKKKATLDRRRKESRRGKQRQSLRVAGQSEEYIRKHLPWKDGT